MPSIKANYHDKESHMHPFEYWLNLKSPAAQAVYKKHGWLSTEQQMQKVCAEVPEFLEWMRDKEHAYSHFSL
jgi:hypothetical protein